MNHDAENPKLLEGFQLHISNDLLSPDFPDIQSSVILLADTCSHYTVEFSVSLHVNEHDEAMRKMLELITVLGVMGIISNAVQLSPDDLTDIQNGA